ncbi:MAG: ABC transporter ATP-binding protein [Candidatus Methanofastidiosa archaeon]|nr:ABC transporter ATP-binding protein [Candidatus Methanofastidiosa archaeon]
MNRFSFLKKVWNVAKEYKWRFLLSYIILLGELAFMQVTPLLLGNVVDAAVYKSDMKLFVNAAIFYALAFICQESCGYLQLHFWQLLNNKYVYSLRVKCYKKILTLKALSLTDIQTGDQLQTINGDTMEFHHVLQRYAMRIVNAGIGTIVSVAIIAYLKWEIALIVAILIPTSVLLTNHVKNNLKDVAGEIRDKQGRYNAWLMEIFKGFREIKLFAVEKNVTTDFTSKNEDIFKSGIKQTKLQFKSNQIIGSIYFISQLIFYIVCAFFVANNSINIAQYITIAGYYTLITRNFQRILQDNMAFQSRKVSIERVFALLESDHEDEEGLSPLMITKGEIKINDLTFSYKEDVKVLNNITYKIEAGKKIGIVGQSGVGKSTMAHLLIKFFYPDKGSIVIDNQDIANCTYFSIRQNIGIVSQETIVFDTTVKDNICFDKNVPDEIIWEILEKAYLKTEIEQLPNGIHTVLGKEGISLSGGQNQRLAIARIFYKNPKIVILDEATSALDEQSEIIVQKALDELIAGRTSLVISHRLNSIKNADQILILKDGMSVGIGSFEDLIENNETFKELFLSQVKRMGVRK